MIPAHTRINAQAAQPKGRQSSALAPHARPSPPLHARARSPRLTIIRRAPLEVLLLKVRAVAVQKKHIEHERDPSSAVEERCHEPPKFHLAKDLVRDEHERVDGRQREKDRDGAGGRREEEGAGYGWESFEGVHDGW